jgi:monofunctional biosynthetic peptidoglycan transglycosylase
MTWLLRIKKAFLYLVFGPLLLVLCHLLIFRYVPVPVTPLMLIRLAQGEDLQHEWVAMEEMSPLMARYAIAGEDQRFCMHQGVDYEAIRRVVDEVRDGQRMRGASTISMQTTKNLYLWPSRSVIRKGLEFGLVHLIELFWSKERIMEVYLNIVELGPGIYGVESASQHHFGRSAAELKPAQAAALVAILPAPRAWSPTKRTPKLGTKVQIIRRIARSMLEEQTECVPHANVPPPARATPKRVVVEKEGEEEAAETEAPADSESGGLESPAALENEDAPTHYQATPSKPRSGKRKKVKPKRRRRSR